MGKKKRAGKLPVSSASITWGGEKWPKTCKTPVSFRDSPGEGEPPSESLPIKMHHKLAGMK